MTTAKRQPIQIKKVSPFPIEATISVGSEAPIKCRIVQMSLNGIMVELTPLVRVGSRFEIHFALPVLKNPISCKVMVVKILDRYAGADRIRAAELHFVDLSGDARNAVERFLILTNSVR